MSSLLGRRGGLGVGSLHSGNVCLKLFKELLASLSADLLTGLASDLHEIGALTHPKREGGREREEREGG